MVGATADRRSNQPIHGAGIDPSRRVSEMERDGLTAEVLYPTEAMHLFHLEDAKLQEECFRVYNDNLRDYCNAAPIGARAGGDARWKVGGDGGSRCRLAHLGLALEALP